MPTVLIHLNNEDAVLAEIDQLPAMTDTMVVVKNPRRRDGKDLIYLDQNVTTVLFPVYRINFIEIVPTGEEEEILIENTETRSQLDNRENAMRLLRSQLYDRELKRRMIAQEKIEAGKKKIEWGSQIRSYVFDDRRVKDHRTDYQTSNVQSVMDGEIDGFIKAYLMEFSQEQ